MYARRWFPIVHEKERRTHSNSLLMNAFMLAFLFYPRESTSFFPSSPLSPVAGKPSKFSSELDSAYGCSSLLCAHELLTKVNDDES